jgi:hypothetical protein
VFVCKKQKQQWGALKKKKSIKKELEGWFLFACEKGF